MKNNDINTVGDRREFFRFAARCGVGGVIGAGAIAVEYKRRRLIGEGKCVNRGACDNCQVLSVCKLPAALTKQEDTNK